MEHLSKHRLATLLISILFFNLLPVGVYAAVQPEKIKVGDSYYINTLFTEGNRIIVKRIFSEGKKIRVRTANGSTFNARSSDLSRVPDRTGFGESADIVGSISSDGADWIVFDSDWYRIPGSKHFIDSEEIFKGKPTVPGSYLPLAPIVEGEWEEGEEDLRYWAESILDNKLTESEFIETVRFKPLPFYSTRENKVILVEAIVNGFSGAYYLLQNTKNDEIVILNKKAQLDNFIRSLSLKLASTSQALAYLKFFTSAIYESEGAFTILDPSDHLLPKYTVEDVVVKSEFSDGYDFCWKFTADMLFRDSLFRVGMKVYPNGRIKMTGGIIPKSKVALDELIVADEARRFYIDNKY